LRPAPLEKLNLDEGTFTEGLCVAEGFTRYYEFLSCTRTGVYTTNEFFSSVVNYYTHLSRTPAYSQVTAVDSSLATYANHAKYAAGAIIRSITRTRGMLMEVLQLCSHAVIGWLDAPSGLFSLRSIVTAAKAFFE